MKYVQEHRALLSWKVQPKACAIGKGCLKACMRVKIHELEIMEGTIHMQACDSSLVLVNAGPLQKHVFEKGQGLCRNEVSLNRTGENSRQDLQ